MPRNRSRVIATVLGLALAACEGPTPPVRTPYDFSSGLGGGTFHWPADRLPVRYWVNPDDSIDAYVARALPLWEAQFSYGEFRGVMVTDSSKADVIFSIFPIHPPHGSLDSLPAHDNVDACDGSTILPSGPSTDAVPVLITWKPYVDSAGFRKAVSTEEIIRCFARVVTHEVGHTLGIGAHSPNSFDLMYGFPSVSEPSAGDRMTAQTVVHTPGTIPPPDRAR